MFATRTTCVTCTAAVKVDCHHSESSDPPVCWFTVNTSSQSRTLCNCNSIIMTVKQTVVVVYDRLVYVCDVDCEIITVKQTNIVMPMVQMMACRQWPAPNGQSTSPLRLEHRPTWEGSRAAE